MFLNIGYYVILQCVAVLDLDNANTRGIIEELVTEHESRVAFYPCDVTSHAELSGKELFNMY